MPWLSSCLHNPLPSNLVDKECSLLLHKAEILELTSFLLHFNPVVKMRQLEALESIDS